MSQATLSGNGHAEDDLDRLLRDYYRARMPRHFPPLPLADRALVGTNLPRSSRARGRWVLAVCVALVLFCLGLMLNSRSPGTRSNFPSGFSGSEAKSGNPMGTKAPK